MPFFSHATNVSPMQGAGSNVAAECLTELTPDTSPASLLQPTEPAGVLVMAAAAAAVSQQQATELLEGLSDEEGAHQRRDMPPADATALVVWPGQKRKRMPAAELMAPRGSCQISKGAPGLIAAPATPPQPKSARMEQKSPSASAEAHAEASTHAAAALADTPADSAEAGAALAMQTASRREQHHHSDPSEGLQSPPEGMNAGRAWQGQTRQADAVLQKGCAVTDSACMALQVFRLLYFWPGLIVASMWLASGLECCLLLSNGSMVARLEDR